MSLSPAEQKVRKLARLPGNTVCPNCGTTKKFGFSTICIKFHTFVCNNCKSSHQAISHRCKSLTMSSWTDAEVAELQQKGNDYCRRTWLKNAPPIGSGGRPREGDHVDVFKRFVVDTYERKAYYGEDDGGGAPVQMSTPQPQIATAVPLARPPTAFAAPPSSRPQQFVAQAPPPAPRPPAPAPAPVADLLDFASAPATTTPSQPTGGNSFTADFDAFAPKAAAPVVPSPSPAPVNDPFAAAPAASSSSSGFSFMSAPTLAAPSAPAPAPVAAKKPVMSSHGNASLISSMDMPQQQQQQSSSSFGFGNQNNNMGTNGMQFNNMNNNPMMQQQQQMMMMQQQQQMMMMQKNMAMNGMGNMGGMGMMGMPNNNNNNAFGMMNNNNNNMMMMGGGGNPMMMNGGFGASNNNTMNNNMNNNRNNNASSMNALDMNISSMQDWTKGQK